MASLSGLVLGGPRGSLFGVHVGWIDASKLINAQHVEDHLDRTGDYWNWPRQPETLGMDSAVGVSP